MNVQTCTLGEAVVKGRAAVATFGTSGAIALASAGAGPRRSLLGRDVSRTRHVGVRFRRNRDVLASRLLLDDIRGLLETDRSRRIPCFEVQPAGVADS